MSTSGGRRDMLMMVVALTLVTVIAAALLGVTDVYTRGPILKAQREMLHRSLRQVLPDHANAPMDDTLLMPMEDRRIPVYLARDVQGRMIAFAWEVVAPDGYSGSIRILMGVMPNGDIHAIRVTDHRETPGLGDGIVRNKAWLNAFFGRSLSNARWAVKKDGGDFDQFTGATITPRAVVAAVKKGLEFFQANRTAMLAAAAQK